MPCVWTPPTQLPDVLGADPFNGCEAKAIYLGVVACKPRDSLAPLSRPDTAAQRPTPESYYELHDFVKH